MKMPCVQLALAIAICAIVVAVRAAEPAKLTWESPKMREVSQSVDALYASFTEPATKANHGERVDAVRQLLRGRLTPPEMVDLAGNAGSLPVAEKDWTGFQRVVYFEMIYVFMENGDRASLVALFSNRCPTRYYFIEIEHMLVLHGKKLSHPILILGEAYWKCRTPEVKVEIAKALRRAFKGSGIRGNDDAEFVKNAVQWYEREKDQLVYNQGYGVHLGPHEPYARHPLFKRNPLLPDNNPMPAGNGAPPQEPAPAALKPLKAAENSLGMKLMLIPAGKFVMGSPDNGDRNEDEERPLHPVRITKPFWLASTEVTQAQYEAVTGKNPAWSAELDQLPKGVSKADLKRFPVEDVTWYEAVEFCNRLSKKEGLPEYYELSPPANDDRWRKVKILGGHGYRLPSEAEWEYACRAGTTTPYYFGDTLKATQAAIRANDDFSSVTTVVGSFPPNDFGLFDMHGSVAEWCNDGYDARYYEDCPIDDPAGASDRHRVVTRGGYWSGPADSARSARRGDEFPWVDLIYVGFRVARTHPAP